MLGEVEPLLRETGIYTLDVSSDLLDSAGRQIAPQSTRIDFELRTPANGEAAEIARRNGLRSLADGNLAQAERFAAELSMLNPNSASVPVIRAQIAIAENRRQDAVVMFRRALEILQLNQDKQYLLWAGLSERQDRINGLSTTIRGMGSQ
jgi:hypothetical protein